tara:strand:- start:434 stop:751 length:318 start_codon:yes stop_codon:yes gene_type:complete
MFPNFYADRSADCGWYRFSILQMSNWLTLFLSCVVVLFSSVWFLISQFSFPLAEGKKLETKVSSLKEKVGEISSIQKNMDSRQRDIYKMLIQIGTNIQNMKKKKQ